jgi:hypothetical protein
MSNSVNRGVTLASVVRTPAFRQGFKHYMHGVEPIFDEPHKLDGRGDIETNRMLAYERGRAFGAYCKGGGIQLDPKAWFINRRLNWRVLDAARNALLCQAIR